MQANSVGEYNVQTPDGKTHQVTVAKDGKGRWIVTAFADGRQVKVAGLRSAKQAIEHWQSAYEHRHED